jgi:hypothetical protein
MKKKLGLANASIRPSREFAEKRLQHATAAAEVTRDRNQKAESAEKEGREKF